VILSLKIHVFGKRHMRLTKEICEKFFEDDGNFVLSEGFRKEMENIFR